MAETPVPLATPTRTLSARYTSVLNFVREVLPILSELGIVVTLGGFVVVQSYLASLTDLFTYNISLVQYLAAGVSLVIYIPLTIILSFARSLETALAVATILSLGFLIFIGIYSSWYLWKRRGQKVSRWAAIKAAIKRFGDVFEKLQPIHRAYNYLTLAMLVMYALGIGFLYGRTEYASMPRWLGGGKPAPVILIFGKDTDTSTMPFAVVQSRSVVVKLIAELTDGVLVWDETSHTAIKVKNDILTGIIGAAPGATPALATPTQTPTPAVTPTASATPHI